MTTERLQFCALVYDAAARAVTTVAKGDLRERVGRQADASRSAVDPAARCAALHLYEGSLKIVPMERGLGDRAFNVALPEAALRDMAFLEPRAGSSGSDSGGILAGAGMTAGEPPTLALLGEDAQGFAVLNAYELDIKERVRVRPGVGGQAWAARRGRPGVGGRRGRGGRGGGARVRCACSA